MNKTSKDIYKSRYKDRYKELEGIKESRTYALKHSSEDKSKGMKFKLAEYFKFDNGHHNV